MKSHNRCSLFQLFLVALFMLGIVKSANAALISRLNGQAYYDTDLNITWLADANLAASNAFGVAGVDTSGGMAGWSTARDWISAMNAANYLGYSDWRLPTLRPLDDISFSSNPNGGLTFDGSNDNGFNVSAPDTLYAGSTAGEMSHLYYNTLGNLSFFDTSGNPYQPGWGLQNSGSFSNIQNIYWYGLGSDIDNMGWFFQFDVGLQGGVGSFSGVHAWAVRSGDVAAVPVPAAFWLFGSGLIGLFGIAQKRKFQFSEV